MLKMMSHCDVCPGEPSDSARQRTICFQTLHALHANLWCDCGAKCKMRAVEDNPRLATANRPASLMGLQSSAREKKTWSRKLHEVRFRTPLDRQPNCRKQTSIVNGPEARRPHDP